MIKKVSIGVDPGSKGAMFALVEMDSGEVREFMYRFDKLTESEMADAFRQFQNLSATTNVYAVLERVHSMPKQGVSSTFKFGQNYGFVRALLIAFKIPFDNDTPQTWMKTYGMKKDKNESGTEWKRRLKEKAQKLYPHMKITNDMADAILIARYCRTEKNL